MNLPDELLNNLVNGLGIVLGFDVTTNENGYHINGVPIKISDICKELLESRYENNNFRNAMRKFVNFTVPDHLARLEMKELLDGKSIPPIENFVDDIDVIPQEHLTNDINCWCNPDIHILEDGSKIIIHHAKAQTKEITQ